MVTILLLSVFMKTAELFFDPEVGGDTFLRNVGYNSADYTALIIFASFLQICFHTALQSMSVVQFPPRAFALVMFVAKKVTRCGCL
jgi:hypothetical protein